MEFLDALVTAPSVSTSYSVQSLIIYGIISVALLTFFMHFIYRSTVLFLSLHSVWTKCRDVGWKLLDVCSQSICPPFGRILQDNSKRKDKGAKGNRWFLLQRSLVSFVLPILCLGSRSPGMTLYSLSCDPIQSLHLQELSPKGQSMGRE